MATLSVKPMKLGPRMREIRKVHGVSASRLVGEMYDPAAETNYDSSFVSRVERGEKEPPDRLLAGFYDVVRPTIDELPEAHLAKARCELNPEIVGPEVALANLESSALLVDVDDLDELRESLADVPERLERGDSDESAAPPSLPETARRRSAATGSDG